MEEGFVKGQSDNLPKIDIFAMMDFFSSNPSYVSAEIKGVKLFKTEYWKSQARKFCDFCKCWLADNKVSISFHENGKRHKENVQKHISQLSKRSAKEFKQKEKMDDEIQKMEAAAMAAYLKDVQNNADLTSQSINEMLDKSSGIKATESSSANASKVTTKNTKPVWHEVKSEKGNYFWNTETSETVWDPPDEYLSIAEQEQQELEQKEKDKKIEKHDQIMKKQKNKELRQEINAHKARERMRELAVKKEDPVPSSTSYGPADRGTKPYGSWTAVVTEPAVQVDLQLPKFEKKPPPPVVIRPEVIKFKEKKLELLGDGPVEFKKRKLNNHKRNTRQTFDDE